MKKILFLSNIPTPYQIDFFEEVEKYCRVSTIFLADRELNRDWILLRKPWISILNSYKGRSAWKNLLGNIKKFQPNQVLIGGYSLPLSLRLRFYCFLHKIPVYYWLECPSPASKVKDFFRKLAWRITLPYVNKVFCIGEKAMIAYRPFSKKVVNLPYSINSERYPIRTTERLVKPLKCVFIGQYISRKGIPELLEAFAQINHDQATLTFFGSGELEAMIDRYAIKFSNITNLGFVNPNELNKLIREFDLLIAPSRHDGWGIVVVEAMMSGLPVISTTNTGAFMEFFKDDDSIKIGSLCEVNAQSIKLAVNSYLLDSSKIVDEGIRARERAIKSLAEVKNACCQLLRELN
jgi:glycosyltransferase involved in cell wall biosynthesis